MTRSSRRGPWLPEEDQSLMELVRTQGPNNWVRISQQLQHRSPKQCRERYHQNLKPTLNHEPISAHEGELIEQMVHEMGKRWAEIARRLGNRSDNAVKNWWNGSMNRRKRNPSQHTSMKHIGNRLYPIPVIRPERSSFVDLPALSPYQHQHHDHREPVNRWSYHSGLDYGSRPTSLQGREYHSGSFEAIKASHLAHPASRDLMSLNSRSDHVVQPYDTNAHDSATELPPLRLPLPDNSSGWQSPLYNHSDRALVSPAISDGSQAPSTRREPSLVSDNQSTCSVSPRTVTSPRASLPVPFDVPGRGLSASGIRIHEPTSLRFHRASSSMNVDEGCSSLMPTSSVTEQKYHDGQADPTFRAPRSPLDNLLHPGIVKVGHSKDTRMHVSSLLD